MDPAVLIPGWLDRQARKAEHDVRAWPLWMRRAAGLQNGEGMMGTTVQTISICERCGEQDVRVGAHGDCPPVGWAMVRISRRVAGSAGWENSLSREWTLCPECVRAVEGTLEGEVNRG